MSKRSRKGACNLYIREAIAKGLKIENGMIVLPSGKLAKPTPTKAGYFIVSLGPENRRRTFTLGRLLCWLIHGPPPNDTYQVDHVNRIRNDDRPENLRWFSASDNAKNISEESIAKVKLNGGHLPHYRGEKHPQAKLTNEQVKEIRQCKQSQNQLATKFGVVQTTISKIQTGKRWR